MANDIRTITSPDNVTKPTLTPQNIARVIVKTGAITSQVEPGQGYTTSPSGAHSDADPNNITDKYQDRLDDPTYY